MFKDGKLDIMIYDSSDWAGKQLRLSWITGGKFYKMFRGIEHHQGFDNWPEALKWICTIEPDKKINSVQFWGHGTPGRVWMNGDYLSARSILKKSEHHESLLMLKDRMDEDSVFWFRSCNVFAGQEGHLFGMTISKMLECRIAAHTYIVGPWQGGLHTIGPDEKPFWSIEEGLKKKKDGTYKPLWSMPWTKNTLFCLTGKIPKGW